MSEDKDKSKSLQDNFLGVEGFWGGFLKFGISGAMVGCLIYLLAHELPATRKQAAEDRKAAIEAQEKCNVKSTEHGNLSVKQLTDAIKDQTKAVNDNAEQHRAVLRDGQRQMLELQRELTQALLGARTVKKEQLKWFWPLEVDANDDVGRPKK